MHCSQGASTHHDSTHAACGRSKRSKAYPRALRSAGRWCSLAVTKTPTSFSQRFDPRSAERQSTVGPWLGRFIKKQRATPTLRCW